MMYAATSGNCGGAPNGVYGIDLDSAAKPVVSYRTNGGGIVGAVAFSSDGALPLNTHGGLLSFGHCGVAGGLAPHAEPVGRFLAFQSPSA